MRQKVFIGYLADASTKFQSVFIIGMRQKLLAAMFLCVLKIVSIRLHNWNAPKAVKPKDNPRPLSSFNPSS